MICTWSELEREYEDGFWIRILKTPPPKEAYERQGYKVPPSSACDKVSEEIELLGRRETLNEKQLVTKSVQYGKPSSATFVKRGKPILLYGSYEKSCGIVFKLPPDRLLFKWHPGSPEPYTLDDRWQNSDQPDQVLPYSGSLKSTGSDGWRDGVSEVQVSKLVDSITLEDDEVMGVNEGLVRYKASEILGFYLGKDIVNSASSIHQETDIVKLKTYLTAINYLDKLREKYEAKFILKYDDNSGSITKVECILISKLKSDITAKLNERSGNKSNIAPPLAQLANNFQPTLNVSSYSMNDSTTGEDQEKVSVQRETVCSSLSYKKPGK